ncbi:MAG: hypothetical protein AAF624_14545 [Bacteroidota bacterium]
MLFEHRHKVFRPNGRVDYVMFWLLLEHPWREVDTYLWDDLAEVGFPQSDIARLSLRDLLVFTLTVPGSPTWKHLAVNWTDDGFPVDTTLAFALEQMIAAKQISQHDRHRAMKARARWKREQEQP